MYRPRLRLASRPAIQFLAARNRCNRTRKDHIWTTFMVGVVRRLRAGKRSGCRGGARGLGGEPRGSATSSPTRRNRSMPSISHHTVPRRRSTSCAIGKSNSSSPWAPRIRGEPREPVRSSASAWRPPGRYRRGQRHFLRDDADRQWPRSATAIPATDATLATISRKQFLFLLGATPHFSLEVMHVQAHRSRVEQSPAAAPFVVSRIRQFSVGLAICEGPLVATNAEGFP